MKEKLLEEAGILTGDLDHLFRQLIHHKYSFATWRLPNTDISYLLIDTKSESPSERLPLEALHDCFVINPYRANHPTHPHVLAGDIIISNINREPELSISPKVSSHDIEKLVHDLAKKAEVIHVPEDSLESYPHDFTKKVSRAIEEINNGSVNKIVLSSLRSFL